MPNKNNEIIIRVDKVSKKFGRQRVVRGVSFDITKNSITGLIGSNGAGKTTTLNMLTGLLLPTTGKIEVFGMDIIENIEEIRRRIAFIPQEISLYKNLTVKENLNFFGGMYIANKKKLEKRIKEVARLLEIKGKTEEKLMNLSGGYQRRASIACAIISNPEILILDEPLAGVDVRTVDVVMNYIKNLNDVTIIFTSHSLRRLEEICDNLIFLDEGKKVLEGSPSDLMAKYSKRFGEKIVVTFFDERTANRAGELIDKKRKQFPKIKKEIDGRDLIIQTRTVDFGVVEILSAFKSLRKEIKNIDIKKVSVKNILNYIQK